MPSKQAKEELIIEAVLRDLGPWAKNVVIGGGYALLVYRYFLSDERDPVPAATRDMDSLIPRSVGKEKEALAKVLSASGYERQFKDINNPPTESYNKEIQGEEIELEFLTDNRTRDHKGDNVKISGVSAQPLSYLEMSLQNVREFKTRGNLEGRVVSPGAWAFHKALTFPRRGNLAKQKKDLYGFWFVLSCLGNLSEEAKQELRSLRKAHPSWAKTMSKNLLPIDAWSPEDWETLEAQDPSGLLTKQIFSKLLSEWR